MRRAAAFGVVGVTVLVAGGWWLVASGGSLGSGGWGLESGVGGLESGVGGLESGVATAVAAAQDFPYAEYDGSFTFVRIRFEAGGRDGLRGYGRGFGRSPPWHHDYPYSDGNLSKILHELSYVRPLLAEHGGNVLDLGDPRLHQFPIAYMSEPGFWNPTEQEAAALRDYLMRGGFIIFDDFGNRERYLYDLQNLRHQMRRVLPELEMVRLDGTESIFDSFFAIDPATIQLFYAGGTPEWWGIFEDNDRSKRLIAVAADHMDLGDFWEHSETGFFPVDMSNEAYKVGVNYIVYAMTH